MLLAAAAILLGFIILVWSADRFVDGAAATAKHLGMPSLLIGMVIVGIGTSAPEMVVSAMAAMDGNPNLALGNALGSNIVNTGLVLGVTALMIPLVVHSKIVRKEIPILIGISLLAGYFCWDGALTRIEGIILLSGFFGVIAWSVFAAIRGKGDVLEGEMEQEMEAHTQMSLAMALFWLAAGLALLVLSSRILVWGAVEVAQAFGVSDLIIGLTIIALGTSLPELAATISAAKKGEHDIAIGNVVGSNMFNLLAVIGIAAVISPVPTMLPEVMARDWPVMMVLTIALMLMALSWKKEGRINRVEGGILLTIYVAYSAYLAQTVIASQV